MKLNIRQIEVFRAVMITGSIRGASELLFVSQPAVSRLLSHTEQRIGFPLFKRARGRLQPTLEAQRLFHEVEIVYEGVTRVNDIARELFEHQEGILNIVASPSIGQMLIPAAIASYRQTHPHVKLTFQYLTQAPLTERLLKRQADLAITILPIKHPNLEQQELASTSLVCICPYNHPLSRRAVLQIKDLLAYPFISYERGSPFCRMVESMFEQSGQPLRSVVEVGSPQNACALVQAGAGIALVDQFSARSWSASRFVTRPIEASPLLHAHLIRLRDEPMSQISQSFIETLKAEIRKDNQHGIQAAA
ncbi:LysR substrate-binding domain-containing protein [Bordetella avium]|uniref:LysR-family transcriptional regulator n=1 Tax=Bordetella avium (strain 197N) TaxID=360910 RepID=Q2KXE7_BORA1|nr:LysR substrate-binding domain-containing protein [Bordetella avium]AZY48223.1 LysR family transcriptional regulator [Bordetella avium]AZY51605.1 LysR family transcriptional regulator [Bordetella avium]RIQ13532.1 LysR family transcriptional regulator [Bordetella avium]RIQ16514.1 LysR family transcriptional regulator [Bordetella avium]RIQ31272.1 LysR family transcriptional regulator [Bordetella avium]